MATVGVINGIIHTPNGQILPTAAATGSKLNVASPAFSWRDLEMMEFPDPAGTDAPQIVAFRGGARSHFYQTTGASDKMDLRGHIPHDMVTSLPAYIHVHWSHDATSISGNIVFTFESTMAKRDVVFPTTKTVTITYATTDLTTTPRWIHRVDEVAWSSVGGSATLFDTADVEVDALIIGTLTMTTLPTLSGGTTVSGQPGVWIHRVDLHYQSTEQGTKNRASNFYT